MSASANEPLDVSELPRLRDEDFRPVDPRYLRVALMGRAIAAAIVAVSSAVLLVVLDGGNWWVLASAMILLGLIAASAVGQVIAVRLFSATNYAIATSRFAAAFSCSHRNGSVCPGATCSASSRARATQIRLGHG